MLLCVHGSGSLYQEFPEQDHEVDLNGERGRGMAFQREERPGVVVLGNRVYVGRGVFFSGHSLPSSFLPLTAPL